MSAKTQGNISGNKKKIFSQADHSMWQKLFCKQLSYLQNKAHPTFFSSHALLNLPVTRIPILDEINHILLAKINWQVVPVRGLLEYESYFQLLANRKFPVAMIMRPHHSESLFNMPDIFHEIFGHCTMLLSQNYAEFMEEFARFALTVRLIDRPRIQRLFWFSIETGLMQTEKGPKIWGASILSSYTEAMNCFTNQRVAKIPFNLIDIFREPYRIDMLQTTYFMLDEPEQIYRVLDDKSRLYDAIEIAKTLGERPSRLKSTQDITSII